MPPPDLEAKLKNFIQNFNPYAIIILLVLIGLQFGLSIALFSSFNKLVENLNAGNTQSQQLPAHKKPTTTSDTSTAAIVSAEPYSGPIIDAHAHVLDLDYYSRIGWPNDPWTGQPTKEHTQDSLREEVAAAWDRYNVVKAIVSGFAHDVKEWKTKHPSTVVSGILVGGEFTVSAAELAALAENGNIDVVGELFSQYYGLQFDDPSLEKYYEFALEHDLPIGIHTGLSDPREIEDGGYRQFRAFLGTPAAGLENVLTRHKGLRAYLMHASYPYTEDLIAIMTMYPHVYIDLASVLQAMPEAGLQRFLYKLIVEHNFGNRIMFGSDVYLWPEIQYRQSIDAINGVSFLSYDQKADIFCHNAATFFKLDDGICDD